MYNFLIFFSLYSVKSDRFCYDYSNPSPIKKTTKHFTSYKTQMNNDGLFKRASLKQNEFKYDIMGITPKCNDRYIDMKKNQLLFFRSIFLLQNKLNVIATNNINNYITNSHDTRRHSIPMLWIHDNKTVYSIDYTDEQRTRKKMKFINGLLG
ncbi:hypothetical protein PFAG_03425 [Plasmodium falciparum Santa Lucia]|uniref:Uncharacterized protein n=7 Tax=Plasmodium falciparum TaxID=5833 RepID=W7JT11_PLAFO|nr:hypothetical protein PFNF135_03591 [Plasmodium falciparum NF135/5.C10]ETW48568.1 hypothetical protein PFMALIP_03380 [Plasmodium falciparum MaliPS096_E11]ETW52953.1 hypothetical protein PFUGPA_05260 [Plasmodium falciparum Palo Alto/Uganda]EUR70268.1 hypothetical protein PFBG_03495 [Plasmodium falciparum 7G8]EUT83550.1 hypothetical protein PFAG_03425 [Plasmodium falciparum Santa Lucia]EWC75802.1 hypothetical protein C923_03511 [Plasmodium falciparum UGT5.1]EWC88063.1 hypothetical protein PFN